MVRSISISFIGLLLASCATSPVKTSESRAVPSSRLLSAYGHFSQSSSDRARIVIIRDAGILGAGAPAKLRVDGAPVALLWPGERVELFVSAGDHIFGVEPHPRLMGALSEASSSAVAGRTYHFRISISESSFKIQPTAQFE